MLLSGLVATLVYAGLSDRIVWAIGGNVGVVVLLYLVNAVNRTRVSGRQANMQAIPPRQPARPGGLETVMPR